MLFTTVTAFSIDKNTFFNEWGKDCLNVDIMGMKIGMSRENINEAWAQNEWKEKGIDTTHTTPVDANTQLETDMFVFSTYYQTNIFKDKTTYKYARDTSLHKDKVTVTVFYNENSRAVAIKLLFEKVFESTKKALLKELDFTYHEKASADTDKMTLTAGKNIKIEVHTPESGKSDDDVLYNVEIFYYHTKKYPEALEYEESEKLDLKTIL